MEQKYNVVKAENKELGYISLGFMKTSEIKEKVFKKLIFPIAAILVIIVFFISITYDIL